jgi:heme o synthase
VWSGERRRGEQRPFGTLWQRMTRHLSRFGKLALATLLATYAMVVIGVIVRSTGSGMGCPDWPLCYGQVIPAVGDSAAWIESIHRWWGVVVGFLVIALALAALRGQRAHRSVVVASLGAVLLTGFQAWLGKVTVETNNAGEWVTAHLAAAMLLLALVAFVLVRSRYPAELPRGASQRLSLMLGFTSASVYALLLFGAHVTSTRAALVYSDWPLFDGQILPTFSADAARAALEMSHFAHRAVAAIVGVVVLAAVVAVWRAARGRAPQGGAHSDGAAAPGTTGREETSPPGTERLLALVGTAAVLYGVQVVVGALQIWTTLEPWAVSLHLALGAAIWALLVAATFAAWYDARVATLPSGSPERDARDFGSSTREGQAREVGAGTMATAVATPVSPPSAITRRDKVRAYVALTKPRIIELLLVTTLPAMVLAWRDVAGLDAWRFAWLAFATLVGGSVAAGAANAINCYLDRDIDELMTRTRRRPLPAHQVAPEDALLFGMVLTVVSFAWLAFTTNLVAAFLTLLAIGFYVVVYTLLLKRSTPQNIVLGGAAGALPPVIGWAAVTGDISLPALLLFAVVFYWTPPHFWALALRIRGDYEAARVPMLPVTHGVPETTRQIALYSVLMVALTLVFFTVARMGLVFLAGALVLGGLFLMQAFLMARERTDHRAVKLYKYSITYLAGLFALIVLDVAVFVPPM